MLNLVRFLFLAVLAIACAGAAPREHDLGHGLAYYRVRELPGDLPKAAGTRSPCVVDVRYVRAESAAVSAFHSWVKRRATPRSPVFVLANAETSRGLVTPLTEQTRAGGVVVVGIPTREFSPHVAVSSTPENERRAYDALERGTPIAALLKDNPDKVRNDEASLSQDRLAEAIDEVVRGNRETPPVDATLQRALHLHRALVALRKL